MAKTIPARWFRLYLRVGLSAALVLAVACAANAATPKKKKPAGRKTAARPAVRRPSAKTGELAALVSAWRTSPNAARRAAVEKYAAAHSKDNSGALAQLALGVGSYEQQDWSGAIAALTKVKATLPQIIDYSGYYLAAARVESKDFAAAAKDLEPVFGAGVPSPLAGRSRLIEARAWKESDPTAAVRTLREHYAELPQPEGDLILADSYLAAKDLPRAAEYYQRVYYLYPTTQAATRAVAALVTLKDTMAAAYPTPPPDMKLRRPDRLMELGEYRSAGAEYLSLITQLSGLAADRARVRVAAADFRAGNAAAALQYLRRLDTLSSDAEAERLYYIEECARRANNDGDMMAALERLGSVFPKSTWRLRALISAGNRYLLVNQPEEYVPLYRAAYTDFPMEPQAALCHWKVTFQAYLRGKSEAGELLREQLRNYPAHATAGAALYFLGRLSEQNNDPGTARACYQRLAGTFQNHYYAMLARDRLARPEIARAAVVPAAERFVAELKLAAGQPIVSQSTRDTALRIDRSRLLRNAGLTELADAELRFGAKTDGQPALLGMEMAEAAEATHQGVRIMKSLAPDYLNLKLDQAPRRFWELLFPLPYRGELTAYARERNLDPYLVAGLIRQESEFNPDARSRANALGLTQVRPGTGRIYARRLGMKYSNRVLFQPAANLKIGTSILRSMLDQNDGKVEQTLASYNAGPNRLAEWLTWGTYREPAEFVESIPFTETRDYVQAVLRNADIYRRLYR